MLTAILSGLNAQESSTDLLLPKGLWAGTVVVDGVSELGINSPLQGGDASTPATTPVSDPLSMRVYIYSDGANYYFLKEATLMVESSDLSTFKLVEKMYANDSPAISGLVGAFPVENGARRVGKRFFTVSYDWHPYASQSSAAAAEFDFTLGMLATAPTNPFYHRYHNINHVGRAFSRTLTFQLTGTSGTGEAQASTAYGAYSESISGITQAEGTSSTEGALAIRMTGRFYLELVIPDVDFIPFTPSQ